MLLQTGHGADIVRLIVVCDFSQASLPNGSSFYILTHDVSVVNIDHVSATAYRQGDVLQIDTGLLTRMQVSQ